MPTVAYHLRAMWKRNEIKLSRTENVGNLIEKYYSATAVKLEIPLPNVRNICTGDNNLGYLSIKKIDADFGHKNRGNSIFLKAYDGIKNATGKWKEENKDKLGSRTVEIQKGGVVGFGAG